MIATITRLARIAFWPYAILIFILTHWPQLAIDVPIHRPDIFIHIAVFGLWTLLFITASFFGPIFSTRNIILGSTISLIYSFIDEALQAIPIIRRHFAWDDVAANALGVITASIAMAILGRFILRHLHIDAPTAHGPITRP